MQTLSACFSATDDSDLSHFMVCHTLQNINCNATHAEHNKVYVIFCKKNFCSFFFTEGSLGQVMEDLEMNFALEEFWMKLGRLRNLA